MTVKRYFAETAREALRLLKSDLGPDAIVVSNRAVEGGIEIMAMSADSLSALSQQTAPRNEVAGQRMQGLLPEHERMLRGLKTAEGQPLSDHDVAKIAGLLSASGRAKATKRKRAESFGPSLPQDVGTSGESADDAIADLESALHDLASTQVDSITETDQLDRRHITDALAALLTQRNDDQPFAIGLFGHWGSGKSSLVRLLAAKLRSAATPAIVVCEFNAWKNEKASSLAAVLAQTVLEKLLEKVGLVGRLRMAIALAARRRHSVVQAATTDAKRWREAAQWSFVLLPPAMFLFVVVSLLWLSPPLPLEWLKPLLSAVAGAVATLSSLRRFLRANLTDWFKRIDGASLLSALRLPDYSSHRGLLVDIHRTLGHLCSLCLQGKTPQEGKYLLLVIDDLDRCSVAAVKEVLDAVRMVADIPRVVTLVAIDERMAYAAIERHYDQFGASGHPAPHAAREHLAKIFQVSITLPEARQTDLERYIASSLFAVDKVPRELGTEDGYLRRDPREDQSQLAQQNGETQLGALGEKAQTVKARPHQWEIALFRDLASAYSFRNPRLLRRLHMSWRIVRTFSVRAGTTEKQLVKLMRILFWREWRLQQSREKWRALDAWVQTGEQTAAVGITKEIANALAAARYPPKEWDALIAVADSALLPSSPSVLDVKQ